MPVVVIGHWEMIPGLPVLAGEALRTAWILSGLLTLPIVLYVGRRFFTGAWHLARRGIREHGYSGRARDGRGLAVLHGGRCVAGSLPGGERPPLP